MPITVQCPGCGRRFQASEQLLAKRVKCPNCSAVIQVAGGKARQAAASKKTPPKPAPRKQPTDDEIRWYVKTADDQQHGPITHPQLDHLLAKGRLDGFCQLRRQDWDDWRWIEDLYPQFAVSSKEARLDEDVQGGDETDTRAAAGVLDDGDATEASIGARLHACPDCGKIISVRATQCPNCGCPITPATVPLAPTERAVSRRQSSWKVTRKALFLAGGVAALVVLVGVGSFVGWQIFRKGAVDSLAQDLSAPPQPPPDQSPPASTNGKQDQHPPATRQQIEQCMQEASAEMAKRVDAIYRELHAASSLVEQFQEGMELIDALAQGNLDRPRSRQPRPPAKPKKEPYKSQYESLYKECLSYVQKNIPADETDRSRVWDVAGRWADSKKAALEERLLMQPQEQPGR